MNNKELETNQKSVTRVTDAIFSPRKPVVPKSGYGRSLDPVIAEIDIQVSGGFSLGTTITVHGKYEQGEARTSDYPGNKAGFTVTRAFINEMEIDDPNWIEKISQYVADNC